MLTIRREQMEVFAAYARRSFEQRMVRHLARRGAFAHTRRTQAEWLALVRTGIATAKSYRVVAERDVARWVELMALLGEDFAEQPELKWAKAILEDAALSPSLRVQLLHQQVTARTQPESPSGSPA